MIFILKQLAKLTFSSQLTKKSFLLKNGKGCLKSGFKNHFIFYLKKDEKFGFWLKKQFVEILLIYFLFLNNVYKGYVKIMWCNRVKGWVKVEDFGNHSFLQTLICE